MIEKIYSTNLGQIHYWTSEQYNKNLKYLVFLPGLTADHRLFEKQIEHFEPLYNVLVWDAPDHASSFPFELNFSLADKAKWLNEILITEGIDAPIIVGQSMGGYVGQMYSQLYPEKLQAFVSIDSAPLQRHYMTKAEIWILKHTKPMYSAYPWKALVRDGVKGCAETEYGRNNMKKMMLTYDSKRYVKLVSHGYKILANAVEADLPYKINCPAILICGEEDKAGTTKTYNKKWHEQTQIPIHWITGAGHNSNADNPNEVNSIIDAFLAELPSCL